jgi:hypothetical protein
MKTYSEFLEEAFKRTGKRIGFVNLHHGSDEDSVSSIKQTGPRPSAQGSQGPGHYVTTDKGKATKYAEFTSKGRGKKPAVVSYRVSSKKVQKTSEIPKGLTKTQQTNSEKPVVRNVRTGHSVIDSEYAKGKIIHNPKPIIVRKKKND